MSKAICESGKESVGRGVSPNAPFYQLLEFKRGRLNPKGFIGIAPNSDFVVESWSALCYSEQ